MVVPMLGLEWDRIGSALKRCVYKHNVKSWRKTRKNATLWHHFGQYLGPVTARRLRSLLTRCLFPDFFRLLRTVCYYYLGICKLYMQQKWFQIFYTGFHIYLLDRLKKNEIIWNFDILSNQPNNVCFKKIHTRHSINTLQWTADRV